MLVEEQRSFIVKECPPKHADGEIITCDCFRVGKEDTKMTARVQIIKVNKKKILTIKFKRRKRMLKRIGYKQYNMRCKIIEVIPASQDNSPSPQQEEILNTI